MSALTLDAALAQTDGAGGRRPPRPPVAAPVAAASEPGESPTVRKRSFSFMPERLSPVKRGEVRVPRPALLKGTGERGFAFHPTDDILAPREPRNQFYAYTAPATPGDLVIAIYPDGQAKMGLCLTVSDTKLQIRNAAGYWSLPTAKIAETAVIVQIEMTP